jgi:hypothetical protein
VTKAQVIFFLNRIRKNYGAPSQEEMAQRGASYETRRAVEEQRERMQKEAASLELALEAVSRLGDNDSLFS